MRIYTEVGLNLTGDIALAKGYVSQARTLLGIMKSINRGLAVQHWERTLPNGTRIVLDSVHGRDRIFIDVPIPASGITIDAGIQWVFVQDDLRHNPNHQFANSEDQVYVTADDMDTVLPYVMQNRGDISVRNGEYSWHSPTGGPLGYYAYRQFNAFTYYLEDESFTAPQEYGEQMFLGVAKIKGRLYSFSTTSLEGNDPSIHVYIQQTNESWTHIHEEDLNDGRLFTDTITGNAGPIQLGLRWNRNGGPITYPPDESAVYTLCHMQHTDNANGTFGQVSIVYKIELTTTSATFSDYISTGHWYDVGNSTVRNRTYQYRYSNGDLQDSGAGAGLLGPQNVKIYTNQYTLNAGICSGRCAIGIDFDEEGNEIVAFCTLSGDDSWEKTMSISSTGKNQVAASGSAEVLWFRDGYEGTSVDDVANQIVAGYNANPAPDTTYTMDGSYDNYNPNDVVQHTNFNAGQWEGTATTDNGEDPPIETPIGGTIRGSTIWDSAANYLVRDGSSLVTFNSGSDLIIAANVPLQYADVDSIVYTLEYSEDVELTGLYDQDDTRILTIEYYVNGVLEVGTEQPFTGINSGIDGELNTQSILEVRTNSSDALGNDTTTWTRTLSVWDSENDTGGYLFGLDIISRTALFGERTAFYWQNPQDNQYVTDPTPVVQVTDETNPSYTYTTPHTRSWGAGGLTYNLSCQNQLLTEQVMFLATPGTSTGGAFDQTPNWAVFFDSADSDSPFAWNIYDWMLAFVMNAQIGSPNLAVLRDEVIDPKTDPPTYFVDGVFSIPYDALYDGNDPRRRHWGGKFRLQGDQLTHIRDFYMDEYDEDPLPTIENGMAQIITTPEFKIDT